MREAEKRYTGGCLCGAVRYEAVGEPTASGYCCCADCRKASGSGCIPFMGFASTAVRISGPTRQFRCKSCRGGDAVRNFCPSCGGLMFGGEVGKDTLHTIYAGSHDDPSSFRPKIAIFVRDRPSWAILPPDLATFDTMPRRE